MRLLIFALFVLMSSAHVFAQSSGVRGSLIDKETGEPVPFTPVFLDDGLEYNAISKDDGFYTIANVPPGEYTLKARSVNYDSIAIPITIKAGEMVNVNISMEPSSVVVGDVEVNAELETAQNEVRVSVVRVTPKEINTLPAAGGEPDFAQYLQVIPGIVFTGDQGGQLYIRGGAPVQNKILLDGMTIFNAFHSIGFFSVFETELIRSADVYTGGFGAQYGGRSSAIVDIRTRAGNKKRIGGLVSINPFVAKAMIEGPLVKLNDNTGSSLSFILTGKHSYLNRTSEIFYQPILSRPKTEATDSTLPYSFSDIHGKISFNAGNGSRLNAFGFSFNDNANFEGVAKYNWNSAGGGIDFRVVPGTANLLMDGNIAYSIYDSDFSEGDSTKERSSAIKSFNANINFSIFFGSARELNYGVEVNSIGTDFSFTNNNGIPFNQNQSNLEAAGYVRYQGRYGNLVIEPSIRAQYYASLGEFRAEPRIGLKYNITDFLRIKFAGGLYSQNLISSVDERDVVNLFVGFLGGPDESVYRIDGFDDTLNVPTYVQSNSQLQTSIHAIGGIELNAGKHAVFNLEPYYKWFPQIISLNRNITGNSDIFQPSYIAERGSAYGVDLSGKYERDQLYVYLAYSLGYVLRNDGLQDFYASFDRRHNLNFLASYKLPLGVKKDADMKNKTRYPFEVSLRWNLGSGFPFTQTQGFYNLQNFQDGINTNYLTTNTNPDTELGVIYDENINTGRLPYYHRLDFSIRYTIDFGKTTKLKLNASITNMYDRANIFYFDRVRYRRVNQLPIMPAVGAVLKF